MRKSVLAFVLAATALSCRTTTAPAVPREYRAFWVETYHTSLATPADIDRVVDIASRANANALFVQVRRRGDSWFLNSREPVVEVGGKPLAFDSLAYLIDSAHRRGIEVHAYANAASVFRDDPATTLPADDRHVFLQHVWDKASNAPRVGNEQWATRARDVDTRGTSYGSRRFGIEWYLDFGHPDAAAYTVGVLTDIVRNYKVDGLHLDRLSYPEGPIDGQPWGPNVGYNEMSVARFNARYGRSGLPAANDAQWSDWRREQITTVMRRVYLTAKEIRPDVVVSAGTITYAGGPASKGGWENSDAYRRVLQDWRAWAEEGIVDAIVTQTFKREHVPAESQQFDDWLRFTTATASQYGRQSIVGVGSYINGVEGTVRQAERVRAAGANGTIFYSMANLSAAVSSNPFSTPEPNASTPVRTLDEVIAAITATAWRGAASTPTLPVASHVDGVFQGQDGTEVRLERDGKVRTVRTDGNGFYGFANVAPGTWHVRSGSLDCVVVVKAGRVTRLDLPTGCKGD